MTIKRYTTISKASNESWDFNNISVSSQLFKTFDEAERHQREMVEFCANEKGNAKQAEYWASLDVIPVEVTIRIPDNL